MANLIFEPGDRNTDISTTIQSKRCLWIYDQQEKIGISLRLRLIADQAEVGTFQLLYAATVQPHILIESFLKSVLRKIT